MKIQVENIRKIKGESSVKAFCTVTINGISINGVKVIKAGSKPFVAMPTAAYEKDGETKYSNVVFIRDNDLYETIQKVVLDAVAPKRKKQVVDDDEPWED